MSTTTVSISFQDRLLSEIDQVAKKESRSRSELLREAARMYLERKNRWEKIWAYGESRVADKGLSEADIAAEISASRKAKKRRER